MHMYFGDYGHQNNNFNLGSDLGEGCGFLYGRCMSQVKCMDDSGMQAGHVNTGVLGSCSCMAEVRA